MPNSKHLDLREFTEQIMVFGRRKDGTVCYQVSPTFANGPGRVRVKIWESERDPFSFHLSSAWYIHANSCTISFITLASSNIQASLLHNACVFLRQLLISYGLSYFLLHEYFISNFLSEHWDKGCFHYFSNGIAKYNLKYLGTVFSENT